MTKWPLVQYKRHNKRPAELQMCCLAAPRCSAPKAQLEGMGSTGAAGLSTRSEPHQHRGSLPLRVFPVLNCEGLIMGVRLRTKERDVFNIKLEQEMQ